MDGTDTVAADHSFLLCALIATMSTNQMQPRWHKSEHVFAFAAAPSDALQLKPAPHDGRRSTEQLSVGLERRDDHELDEHQCKTRNQPGAPAYQDPRYTPAGGLDPYGFLALAPEHCLLIFFKEYFPVYGS